jgi:hypothetical protein
VTQLATTADLAGLTALLDATILAELPAAASVVLSRVQDLAAVAVDVQHLMDGLSPLARAARYGSVRETPVDAILRIVDGLFDRIVVGLVPACHSLDDAAAARMLESITAAQESVALLDRPGQRDEWAAALRAVVERDSIHGLVRGGACRLLVEQGRVDATDLERFARLALSPAAPPAQAAAWAEGLLRGSALLLLHHDGVWRALDEWLASLDSDAFVEMLPLVRRAFADFDAAERRQMGERVKRLVHGAPGSAPAEPADEALDAARGALVHPVLSHLLGVDVA